MPGNGISRAMADALESADVAAFRSAIGVTTGGPGGVDGVSDVPGLVDALAGKASTSHTHATSDVTGLDTALAGKAASTHSHAQSDITGLTTALAGKAAASHTHDQADVTGLVAALDGKSALGHSHTIGDVASLQTTLDGKASTTHTHDDRYYTEAEVDALLAGVGGGNATFASGAITTTATSSNTTWTPVTGADVPVVAGRTYSIRWRLRTYSAAATTGLRVRRALTGGAAGTVLGQHFVAMTNATAATVGSAREGTADPSTAIALGNATNTTTAAGSHWVDLLFACTGSGTLTLEIQSEVNTSAATVDGDGSYWEAVGRPT